MGIKIGESKVKCRAICKYTVQQASDGKINELYQILAHTLTRVCIGIRCVKIGQAGEAEQLKKKQSLINVPF